MCSKAADVELQVWRCGVVQSEEEARSVISGGKDSAFSCFSMASASSSETSCLPASRVPWEHRPGPSSFHPPQVPLEGRARGAEASWSAPRRAAPPALRDGRRAGPACRGEGQAGRNPGASRPSRRAQGGLSPGVGLCLCRPPRSSAGQGRERQALSRELCEGTHRSRRCRGTQRPSEEPRAANRPNLMQNAVVLLLVSSLTAGILYPLNNSLSCSPGKSSLYFLSLGVRRLHVPARTSYGPRHHKPVPATVARALT
ncbi:uncharacterized protein [Odocoileus virginianus]|uniref:Uncharacterized protein n=1 Tax=Odocoileus virginianus TaxID=9874 RepID=A0ABM4J321_ODOVR